MKILDHFFGNKAKGRISKRVFQERKARQNFRKINISYPSPPQKKILKNIFSYRTPLVTAFELRIRLLWILRGYSVLLPYNEMFK